MVHGGRSNIYNTLTKARHADINTSSELKVLAFSNSIRYSFRNIMFSTEVCYKLIKLNSVIFYKIDLDK